MPLPAAVAAASRNPLALLGVTDRGRIAVGQRADLVELDDDLTVRRVMRAGRGSRLDLAPSTPQRGGIASNVRSMSSSTRIVASVTTSR